jgi:hypothetical protein
MDEELIATVEGDVTTYTVAADQMGEGIFPKALWRICHDFVCSECSEY